MLDADIRDYFGSIDHQRLLALVARRVSDRRVLKLLRLWLAAGVMEDGQWSRTMAGTPQGGDLSRGRDGFDFLGCHLRKQMSGPIWNRTRQRVFDLHRGPSQRAMTRVRARVRALTGRARCHTDLREVIADVNPVLRGWAQYFRTGNAADHFTYIDEYAEQRLRGLLLKRAGSRLTANRSVAWRRPFFEALGLLRLRGTIQYPGMAHATT